MTRRVDGSYFTIAYSRLQELCSATGMAGETIAILALDQDWPEGAEHQCWLDTAPIAEVASWLQSLAVEAQ